MRQVGTGRDDRFVNKMLKAGAQKMMIKGMARVTVNGTRWILKLKSSFSEKLLCAFVFRLFGSCRCGRKEKKRERARWTRRRRKRVLILS